MQAANKVEEDWKVSFLITKSLSYIIYIDIHLHGGDRNSCEESGVSSLTIIALKVIFSRVRNFLTSRWHACTSW